MWLLQRLHFLGINEITNMTNITTIIIDNTNIANVITTITIITDNTNITNTINIKILKN